jgi:glutamate dehydrogenase/leucine dehydrogenase
LVKDAGLSPNPALDHKVGDLITGYGTAESVRHFYNIYGGSVKGKRVIIQGWGNVGSAAAYYLAQSGAKIVGIIDRVGGLMNPEGFSFEEIKNLYNTKTGNYLVAENMLSFDEVDGNIWSMGAEVFIPAAASRLINRNHLHTLLTHGLEVISAGANVPFADPEIFYGAISEEADQKCAVIPDFISNCGMARVFGYLMGDDVKVVDTAIFEDVSTTIEKALRATQARHISKTELTKTAYEIALEQLI